LTKGFTRLLKKGIPFHWDDVAQKVFDALKDVLVWASLLYPLDYQHNYFLYLSITISTIAMVLFQEDDMGAEHPIYYPSRNLNHIDIQYTHVEKLALVTIQAI